MSKISSIHDAIVAAVTSVLPTHHQLTNPYDPSDNNELYLTRGFGVGVGPGLRTDRNLSCQASWERSFSVLLTRQVTATDHNTTAQETIVKDLLEDHFLIFEELEKETTLSQLCIKSQVEADTGIEFVETDRSRYYLMQLDLITEYTEDLT